MTTVYPFQLDRDYVKVHNALFDVVMPALSPNGWKVFCYIVRKTIGYNKRSDFVSYSQIMTGCGIGSRTTVSAALKELADMRAVVATGGDKYDAIRYRVNRTFSIEASPETGLDDAADSPEIGLGPSPESGPEPSPETGLPLVQKLDTQKTSTKNKEKTKKNTGADAPSYFAIAQAIARVCVMPFEASKIRNRCFAAAKDLQPLAPSVEQVDHFNRWARLNWWRCTKSNQLYPEDFVANWQQAMAWNGTVRMQGSGKPSGDTPESIAFREAMRRAAMGEQ